MKKVLMLGLVLVSVVYALPLAAGRLLGVEGQNRTQDSVSVHADQGAVPKATVQADPAETERMIDVRVGNETRKMPLETYVAGVVAAEISPSFPVEAIRAQAVAARTYAVYKINHGHPAAHDDADVCDDFTHCAAYIDLAVEASGRWGSSAEEYKGIVEQAVEDTAGQVVTVDGEPIIAVFSAAAGPRTESAQDVWGSDISYLQSVDSPGGEECPKYRASVTVSAQDFRKKVAGTFPNADLTDKPSTWFKGSTRSAAGGIQMVQMGGVQVAGTDIRALFGLNSTNFTIEPADDAMTFQTIGYGHGVGLSQYGAKHMADEGSDYRAILTHYYKDTAVTELPPL